MELYGGEFFRMKNIFRIVVNIVVGLVIFYGLMKAIRENLDHMNWYIAVIIILFIKLIFCIIIARFSRNLMINVNRMFFKKRRKKKKISLFNWTNYIQDVEEDIKKLIGHKKASNNIIDSIDDIKQQIHLYFQRDKQKMKKFKAYLNVVEKDSTLIAFQTFLLAMLSAGFVSVVATGNVKWIIRNYVMPKIEGELLGDFYYTAGFIFLILFITIIVGFIMNYTDKTRVRILQEVMDLCIDEIEEGKK